MREILLLFGLLAAQAYAQSVSPISPGTQPERAITTNEGNLPPHVKVVGGRRGGTVIPLTLDEGDRLRVDATVSEVATAAEEDPTPALYKVVAGKRGSSVVPFTFDPSDRLRVDATVSEVATAAEEDPTPALYKVVAGKRGSSVVPFTFDPSDRLRVDATVSEVGTAADGAPVPAEGKVVAGKDGGGNARYLLVDSNGRLSVDVNSSALPADAATETKQDDIITELQGVNTTATSIDGKLDTLSDLATEATLSSVDGKLNSLGQKNMDGSVPVVVASDQSAIPASQSGTWNINDISGTVSLPTGAATEATLIEINEKLAAKAGAPAARLDYSGTNVTTGAYVEIVAATASEANEVEIFDSSGQTLVLATGAASSEVDAIYIFPGGNGRIPLAVPVGTRLSVKAVSATADEGELVVNLYGP